MRSQSARLAATVVACAFVAWQYFGSVGPLRFESPDGSCLAMPMADQDTARALPESVVVHLDPALPFPWLAIDAAAPTPADRATSGCV
ncbi:MAG: hypothetical protein AAGE01_20070 [Pseudomonadota bacterium]